MIEQWRKQLLKPSGNLTTNEVMPSRLIEKLLEESPELEAEILFDEIEFPKLGNVLDSVKGLNIIAGMQNLKRKDYLTVFRAMRFPTYKRIHTMVSELGYAVLNYEQERILSLYKDGDYISMREKIRKNPHFWVQSQERVVEGLPIFHLVNDALQIHRAFRGDHDEVAMMVIHIPRKLIETGKFKLIANAAIDLDYKNAERDFVVKDFSDDAGSLIVDSEALLARGVDLHEMYTKDLPLDIDSSMREGIEQEFFLLNIYKISDFELITRTLSDSTILKKSKKFLHGFFGDQNIFARRKSEYLPDKCQRILKRS